MQRNLELVHPAGCERHFARVRVERDLFAIELGVALESVRGPQVAFGHDRRARLRAGRAFLRRLRELLRKLDDHVGIRPRRGDVHEQLRAAGDFEIGLERRAGEGQHGAHGIGTLRPHRHHPERPGRLRIAIGRLRCGRRRGRARERAVVERGHGPARSVSEIERLAPHAGRRPYGERARHAGVLDVVLDVGPRFRSRSSTPLR